MRRRLRRRRRGRAHALARPEPRGPLDIGRPGAPACRCRPARGPPPAPARCDRPAGGGARQRARTCVAEPPPAGGLLPRLLYTLCSFAYTGRGRRRRRFAQCAAGRCVAARTPMAPRAVPCEASVVAGERSCTCPRRRRRPPTHPRDDSRGQLDLSRDVALTRCCAPMSAYVALRTRRCSSPLEHSAWMDDPSILARACQYARGGRARRRRLLDSKPRRRRRPRPAARPAAREETVVDGASAPAREDDDGGPHAASPCTSDPPATGPRSRCEHHGSLAGARALRGLSPDRAASSLHREIDYPAAVPAPPGRLRERPSAFRSPAIATLRTHTARPRLLLALARGSRSVRATRGTGLDQVQSRTVPLLPHTSIRD